MKRAFVIGSLLAAASFSPSLLAAQPVQDVNVDARLQVISAQLDKTNALLGKLVGEVPDNIASDKPRPDPEMFRKSAGYKNATERSKNECSGFDAEPQRYPEGREIEVKGKSYKCVTGPHWQEQ